MTFELTSWNDGPAKQSVVDFVNVVTAEGGENYVAPDDRLAVFDNDGTLWSEHTYGIPSQQVIGSSIETRYEIRDGNPVLVRLPVVNHIDDKEGKPVGINRYIGRRPLLAFGNSDGDHEMLQWTWAGDGLRFCGLVHHTDAEREWAYDRGSHIGSLDKAWDEALEKGWTMVSMKDDWRKIYPFE